MPSERSRLPKALRLSRTLRAICNGRPSRAIFSIGKVTPLPSRGCVCALCVGLDDREECGDDMPLTGGYIVEDNGRIGRVEREQAYTPGWTATARSRALFLGIAPDGIVPASL